MNLLKSCRIKYSLECQVILTTLIILFSSASANAASYGVSPLTMTFSQMQKSNVLTVVNEDRNPVSLRVKAMEWTQDKDGNDVYEDTKELIFFLNDWN